MEVPFFHLHRQYEQLKNEIDTAVAAVLHNGLFIGGKEVEEFELAFAAHAGAEHCISCANGTDSIEMLLQAFDIGEGDEVIVPAHSWISTAGAVSTVGAVPVFADTLPFRYTIDPSRIKEVTGPKTRAIIPVHLFGQPAEMDEIMTIAKESGLVVIEDCAQAHGALYKGRRVGSIGHAASFSFYPTKNLGALGDGGAMLTSNTTLAEKLRMMKNYGQKEKNVPLLHGRNSRLDTLQAAVLRVKLPYLAEWNELRRRCAIMYREILNVLPLCLPEEPAYSQSVYHLFVVQTEKREALAQHLNRAGISTAVHYPVMLPFLPVYRKETYAEQFPTSSQYQNKILSLPMFPELQEEEVQYVGKKIVEFFRK